MNKGSIVVKKKIKKKGKERARVVLVGTVVCRYTAHLLCDFEEFSTWHSRSVTQNPAQPVLLSKAP